MARERGLEFKVGLLIVVAAVILGGFVFVLGNFSLRPGFTIHVQYAYSGNLQEGAPVKVAGIKVGKVESVRFVGGKELDANGNRVQVVVDAWIESRVRDSIRQDAEYFINTAGVLGEQYLEIVPGDDYQHDPIEPGATVIGSNPPRTDLVVSRLYEVLENLSVILRDDKDVIRDLLVNSASAVKEVNTLLVDNREQLGTLIGSTSELAGQASQTLDKVNQGIGDPRLIRRTIEHADGLLVTAQGAITRVTPAAVTLLDDATRVTGIVTEQRVDKALAAADKAATAAVKAGGLIDNVDGMVTDLRAGKGTAGALLVKEELYADLRELIRDLKRNPWKFFWKE
jgi:phospholipid/cholesterol/gamma-HCH transport system substrate-binding protein